MTDSQFPGQGADAIRRFTLWEMHGQTIMLGVITAALLFTARTLYDSNAVQSSLLARIDALSTQVARLEGALSQMQSQYVTRPEFTDLQARTIRLESLAHAEPKK